MKDSLKLIASLSIICLVCALLVAAAHEITLKPIADAEASKTRDAILAVLPAGVGDATTTAGASVETKTNLVNDAAVVYYETSAGYAIETSVNNGYSGEIKLMLGFSKDGKFWSYKILAHAETPGLGAHIDGSFLNNVKERDAFTTNWKVTKDGGDIVPITAATISSRAVCDAIEHGVGIIKAIQNK